MTSAIPSTGKITGLCAALAMTVAGCVSSPDPVYTQFHREAGSLTDLGTFGNATLNNRLVMTGERQYTFDLANRFAGEVESTVTLPVRPLEALFGRETAKIEEGHRPGKVMAVAAGGAIGGAAGSLVGPYLGVIGGYHLAGCLGGTIGLVAGGLVGFTGGAALGGRIAGKIAGVEREKKDPDYLKPA